MKGLAMLSCSVPLNIPLDCIAKETIYVAWRDNFLPNHKFELPTQLVDVNWYKAIDGETGIECIVLYNEKSKEGAIKIGDYEGKFAGNDLSKSLSEFSKKYIVPLIKKANLEIPYFDGVLPV